MIIKRIRKETAMHENIAQNKYPRKVASQWYKREQRDFKEWKGIYSEEVLRDVHQRGYLGKSIESLNLLEHQNCTRITDRDYLYLQPMNNRFSKWIADMNTMERMFPQYSEHFLKIYFSLIRRDETLILEFPSAKKECGVADILALLKNEQKKLLICPAFWTSKKQSYEIEYCDAENVYVDGKSSTVEEFEALVGSLQANYLVCDCPDYSGIDCGSEAEKAELQFYIANDLDEDRKILCALVRVSGKEKETQYLIDLKAGTYSVAGETCAVPNWEKTCKKLREIALAIRQVQFYSISIIPCGDSFKIVRCSPSPALPQSGDIQELDSYLKFRLEKKREHVQTREEKVEAFRKSFFAKYVRHFCKPGIRPYMQKLWLNSLKSDLTYKGTSLPQKVWAWRRGFLSYRIEQYGLTEENYKTFLSDYQYHWLNRINNVYQKWINDKTTFRYVMGPFKEYIPDYYFSVYKEYGIPKIVRMQDCPAGVPCDYHGISQLLREQGKLVFKPSAGTHGDGFYCLEYHDGTYYVNGEAIESEEGIDELIQRQKSFYIVTSYINMHPDLKKIYPKSVNSIRIMVINRHGYDPKIMQTYMRIGSSKTGFTDNVGYGGICAMINMETGVMYDPESLRDHVYYPCPKHPDTGTEIAGIQIPHWNLIRQKVVEICQLFPELEYLGFDIAVTEDSFNVMEINIHQDLHKVALHSDEIREFYRDKIRYKERRHWKSSGTGEKAQ